MSVRAWARASLRALRSARRCGSAVGGSVGVGSAVGRSVGITLVAGDASAAVASAPSAWRRRPAIAASSTTATTSAPATRSHRFRVIRARTRPMIGGDAVRPAAHPPRSRVPRRIAARRAGHHRPRRASAPGPDLLRARSGGVGAVYAARRQAEAHGRPSRAGPRARHRDPSGRDGPRRSMGRGLVPTRLASLLRPRVAAAAGRSGSRGGGRRRSAPSTPNTPRTTSRRVRSSRSRSSDP